MRARWTILACLLLGCGDAVGLVIGYGERVPDTGTRANTDTGSDDTDTGTHTDIGTGTNIRTDTGTETRPDIDTDTATGTGSSTDTDTGTGAGTSPDTGTGTDMDTGTNPGTSAGTDMDTGTDTGTGTSTEIGTDTDDTDTGIDSGTGADTDSEGDTETAGSRFIIGADISWVQEQEDLGVRFTDDGEPKDILQLLKDHGFNAIRLRIFHDPGQPEGYQYAWTTRIEPYCDLPHTIEMARRVKDAGMRLFLDFHYSDTWADPANQIKPAAWADLEFDELKQALADYTREALTAFRDAGCLPDMVQLGNEITPGMLFPDGKTFDPDNWDQLAELLKTAAAAVKAVDPGIKVVLHLDKGDDNDATVWWVEEALARNVAFDVLAESTYPKWQGEPAAWRANFADLASRYPRLSFLIAEYADAHREAADIMWDTPRGLGAFVWEPTADGDWGQGLFDMPDGEGDATPRATLELFDQMAVDFGLR